MAFSKSSSLNLIQKHIQRGQIDKAIKELENIIDVEQDEASLHIKLGDLLLRKSRKQEAKDAYNRAASIYLKDGFNNRAIATYKMVSRIDPNNLDVNINIAELFEKQGLIGDALQQYKYAAKMYGKQGKFPETIRVLQKVLDLDPTNSAAKIKMAEIHFKNSDPCAAYEIIGELSQEYKEKKAFQEQVKTLEYFLGIEPKDKYLLKEIARAYIHLGNSEEGLKRIQAAQKLDQKDVGTMLILAETYIVLDKYNDAESIYCDILRQDNKNHRAKFGLSKIFLGKDNVDEAIKELEPFYNDFVENSELLELADFYNEALKKKPNSIDILEKLAEIYRYYNNIDKLSVVYEQLAGAYEINGQTEKADFLYQKILQINPNHVKAKSYFERGNHELFTGAFSDHATEANSDVINEHITEANVYLKYGLYDQVQEHIDFVLNEDKNNLDARILLKDLLLAQNEKKKAVDELFSLSEYCLVVEKNTQLGIKFLQEVLKVVPDNPKAMERLENLGANATVMPDAGAKTTESFDDFKSEIPDIENFEGIDLVVEEPPEIIQQRAGNGGATKKQFTEALEEAEFYFAEGLFDDAKNIYKRVLLDDPYNMMAVDRLEQIEIGSGNVNKPMTPVREGDQIIDFARELEASLPDDVLGLASNPNAEALDDRVEAENIFSKFKKGIEENIDLKDYDSHYNLGIAYKEMGLLADSIEEFKKAFSADSSKILECYTMLGMVALEMKNYADAIGYIEKIFSNIDLPSDKKIGLRYELGKAYSEKGKPAEALKCFNMVKDIDPSFKNVKGEIQMLLNSEKSTTVEQKVKKKNKISYI